LISEGRRKSPESPLLISPTTNKSQLIKSPSPTKNREGQTKNSKKNSRKNKRRSNEDSKNKNKWTYKSNEEGHLLIMCCLDKSHRSSINL
jgi:hypothetical protein